MSACSCSTPTCILFIGQCSPSSSANNHCLCSTLIIISGRAHFTRCLVFSTSGCSLLRPTLLPTQHLNLSFQDLPCAFTPSFWLGTVDSFLTIMRARIKENSHLRSLPLLLPFSSADFYLLDHHAMVFESALDFVYPTIRVNSKMQMYPWALT